VRKVRWIVVATPALWVYSSLPAVKDFDLQGMQHGLCSDAALLLGALAHLLQQQAQLQA
jgi:hypothetical protein